MQAVFVFHFLTKHVNFKLQMVNKYEQNRVNSFGVHHEHSSRQEEFAKTQERRERSL